MKYITYLIIVLLSIFNVNSQVIDNIARNIPILGWYGIPPSESTKERFLEQRESGITHNFTFYSSVEELSKALDAAEQAGIKLIISCPQLKTNTKEVVERFMKHSALAGYFLRDEPASGLFPELETWVRNIRSIDSTHFCYINLLPTYVSNEILGVSSYRQYIQTFIQKVNPQILSFDHYPIILENNGRIVIRDTWYENLEIISDEATKNNLPFWAFILSTEHSNYPYPTLGQLKLQAFANLAYGAQGIQYFTYWTPPGDDKYKFRNGPIEFKTGKKTDMYLLIKDVNQQINNLSRVFLNSKVSNIGHMGDIIPKGSHVFSTLPKAFRNIDAKGNNILISYLQNKDINYLVIVNKNFVNTITIDIDLKSSSIKQVLQNDSFSIQKKGKHTYTIPEGDILIFSWVK